MLVGRQTEHLLRNVLEGAQQLCRRYGTLFCVDEVQTGFGRTGKLFAFEHWGLEPDLVPVSKALSGGYVPVGGLLMSKWVHERVFDSMENAFSHGSTFAPNELAMAAGLATLRELDEQRLVERSAQLGKRLLELTTRALAQDRDLANLKGYVEDSGEGRWTIRAAIDEAVPVPVLSAALYERFSSRGEDEFADKLLSALRFQFGGHKEKTPEEKGKA